MGLGPSALADRWQRRPALVSLAIADWIVKLSVALIALIPFRILAGVSR